ncbi:MAG: copper chaperone PCu(A)C [Dokdonella sp.]|uniref:copper chaperone PCu(A)C n=1 Tax=Dokdonella sp. TaxID=2291710 RepID=UPI0032638EA3
MHRSRLLITKVAFAALVGASPAHAAGKLTVHDAWIRMPPPGSEMSAGYATLANTGDEPISVLTVQSNAYRMTSLHETVTSGDVSKMRELHRLKIAAGETIQMKPGGKHLMLMQPRRDIAVGEKVEMMFLLLDGTRVETYFDVVPADASGD